MRGDLIERLRSSPEPAARWVILHRIEGRPADDPDVTAAHAAVLADPGTERLIASMIRWDQPVRLGSHDKPAFVPNTLRLLDDMGVTAADDERIAAQLTCMLEHQADDGRFLALTAGHTPEPVWAAVPCDSHAILESLARAAGLGADPRVRRAFERMRQDVVDTSLGTGFHCVPDPQIRFRGPGRKADPCPQVALEAIRAWSYLPPAERPAELEEVARTALRIWQQRDTAQPYMFGHGRQFKRGKWPQTWYSAYAVLDALGRVPEVWSGPGAQPEDCRSMAEIAAVVQAYMSDEDGRVTPRSVHAGFADYSFGQKKRPSDLASALVALALMRVEPLAELVADVDVRALASSKGGSGLALPP